MNDRRTPDGSIWRFLLSIAVGALLWWLLVVERDAFDGPFVATLLAAGLVGGVLLRGRQFFGAIAIGLITAPLLSFPWTMPRGDGTLWLLGVMMLPVIAGAVGAAAWLGGLAADGVRMLTSTKSSPP